MKLLSSNSKNTLKIAGLATLATALVSFAINKLIEIELNFWMLLALLVFGTLVFIYIDVTGKKGSA